MKNNEQYKRIITFVTATIILFLETAVFWFVWYKYYNFHIMNPFFRRGNWLISVVYALSLAFFTKIYGGYKIGYYKNIDIIFSQILGVIFVNGITYLQICLLGLRLMHITPLLIMTVFDMILINFWTIITGAIFKKLYPPHKMLLIHGDRPIDLVLKKIGTRKDKYQICATINVDKGMDMIMQTIQDFDAIIICDIPSEYRNKILKFCFEKSIRTYVMPKISDIILMGSDNINLFDTPLLLSRNYGLTFDQKLIKRLCDIVISCIGIVITSPIMILVAILIKLYDNGPILYKQERLTINGKKFNVLKFRSMIVNAEKDGVARLAGQNDDRITPIGKFIRAVRFDELPQLFNILLGDMSIVGPRPERPEIAEQYKDEMPEFDYRLKIKAGLTGYAQVYGKYNTTPYDKLKLDLSYIENYSFWLDIKLIILTIKVLFQKESTEGVEDGQRTAAVTNIKKKNHDSKAKSNYSVGIQKIE